MNLILFYLHDYNICDNPVIGIMFLSCYVIVMTVVCDIILNPNPSHKIDMKIK